MGRGGDGVGVVQKIINGGGVLGCGALGLGALAIIVSVAQAGTVDLNRASAQELQQIKGIGAKTAERIVLERARGPFESLEHLSERLSGIGPKTIVKLEAAGLCAGTPGHSCAQGQPASRRQSPSGVSPSGVDSVTPELIKLP